MSEPGKPSQASRLEADERLDFCHGDKARKRIECTDAVSGQTAEQGPASLSPQGDEETINRRPGIHLSDRDRDFFLALLDSDEGPNEALRQAAERFKRKLHT